jgi:hypothetical protein
MRFSLSVAAVLVISGVAFAQHSSTAGSSSGSSSHSSSGGGGGGSSSHASSSGGASHSASSHTSSSGSSSSSRGSSASAHGSSAASAGSHSSAAASHSVVEPSHGNAPHDAHTGPANAEIVDNKLPVHEPVGHPVQAKEIQPSAPATAQPEKRTFFSFLHHPFHKANPDLRHAICKEGPCKKQTPPPVAVESELRPPICKGKACQCPPGEAPGPRGGCTAVPTNPTTCAAGQYWNGGACVPSSNQCLPNQYWNGATCANRLDDFASINSRAAMLGNEIRGSKSQMEGACQNNSSAPECNQLKTSYDGAVDRYRMLQNEAPFNCRSMLIDPLAF